MKILAFSASNSSTSINRALIDFSATRLQTLAKGVTIDTPDLNDYDLPIYSSDIEAKSGIPAAAQAFYDKIGAADAVLVSFAEHNGSTTAVWKNMFDWMSRIEMKVWQDKPIVMLAASPGGRAGAGVLGGQTQMAPHFGGSDLRGTFGVGTWYEAWDAEAGVLTKPEDIAGLDAVLAKLVAPA